MIHRSIYLGLLSLAVLLPASPLLSREQPTLLNLQTDKTIALAGGRGGKHGKRAVDVDGGKAMRLCWLPGAKRLLEAPVPARPYIKAYRKGVTLSYQVNADGHQGFRKLGVRVIDANNEIWQFGAQVDPKKTGWQDVQITLAKNRSNGHWGGSSDGKNRIDLPVRLLSIIFMAPKPIAAEQFLLVRSIKRNAFDPTDVEPEIELLPIKVKLDTGCTVAVIRKGHEDDVKLTVTSPAGHKALTFTAAIEFEAFNGHKVQWQQENVALAGGETKTLAIGKVLDRSGHWRAKPRLVLPGSNAVVRKPSVPIAYLKPAGTRPHPPADGFWFGMDARVKDVEKNAWKIDACALVGMDYVRSGVTWPGIQPESADKFTWERHLAILGRWQEKGIKVQYGLCFTPQWAARPEYVEKLQSGSGDQGKKKKKKGRRGAPKNGRQAGHAAKMRAKYLAARLSRTPPQKEAWRSFIKAVVEKNKARGVIAYEIWNEPDLKGFFSGTTAEYLELLKVAYEEIKKGDPNAHVLSGGIATMLGHHGHALNPDLIKRMLVDAQDHYDAICLHQHGEFDTFQTAIDGPLAKLRQQLKTPKPIWFTETGSHARPDIQAQTLVKKIAFAKTRNTIGFSWFALALSNPGKYSIMNTNRTPRPAYSALNELVKLMRDAKHYDVANPGPGNILLGFEKGQDTILVGWDEAAPTANQRILLRLPDGATAEVIDIMGNAEAADVHAQVVNWTFTKEPKYLRVIGGKPELVGALVSFSGQPYGEPGSEVKAEALVRNPLPQAATFELTWTRPDGTQTKESLEVPAKASQKAALAFPMPASKAGAAKPRVKLDYALATTPWKGSLSLPLHAAQLIPAKPMAERQPDFVVDSEKQVHNGNRHDPSRKAFVWTGPADLSAKVWLRLENDALLMKVDVSDDKHLQPNKAQLSWRADGIQFGLKIPGKESYWEIGLARNNDGEAMSFCWSAPMGASRDYAEAIKLTTTPRAGGLIYEARLPLADFGADAAFLRSKALGFNLLVNDEDGGGREGFCYVAEGLGKRKDPSRWPLITFE